MLAVFRRPVFDFLGIDLARWLRAVVPMRLLLPPWINSAYTVPRRLLLLQSLVSPNTMQRWLCVPTSIV